MESQSEIISVRKQLLVLTATLTIAFSLRVAQAAVSFAQRCAAPGVLVCEDFNTPSDRGFNNPGSACVTGQFCTTTQGSLNDYGAYTFSYSANHPVISNDRASEGAGSMRIAFPPGYGMDNAGLLYMPFTKTFVPCPPGPCEWWIQWKQYIPSAVLTADFGPYQQGFKQIDLTTGAGLCGNISIPLQNHDAAGIPHLYTECGLTAISPVHQGDQWTNPFVLQGIASTGADYYCDYFQPSTCLKYVGDAWMVWMVHVKLGPWGTNTSTVEAWAAVDGQPLKKWLGVFDWPFLTSNDTTVPSQYDEVILENYVTQSGGGNNPLLYTYYDELIVSTQAIPDPAAGGIVANLPPAKPRGLVLR